MNVLLTRALASSGALAFAVGIGFCGAWYWQANTCETALARQSKGYAADLALIATAGAAQAQRALERQQRAEAAVAALDTQRTMERADALAENERLRRAVADGARRLHIAGRCSAATGKLPETTSAPGLGNTATIELAAAAGRTVFDIRRGVIADQRALRILQEYVRSACR
jgi:prophage endopeptidase